MNDAASLPVVIGVSGHRDLRDEDRPHLEQRVREILLDLGARYPATPLQLLSLLAEGADQLAARVALDLGVSLVVVLPMPQAEYEQDFTTSQSRADFQDLLHRAGRTFELPAAGESDFGDDAARRDRQYALVGAYIAHHSQFLIALWDGGPSRGVGDTADVVRFKLEGVPPALASPHSVLDPVESGPVYHLLTPSHTHPQPEGTPFALIKFVPKGDVGQADGEATSRGLLWHFNTFNRDAERLASRLTVSRQQSKHYVLPNSETEALPASRDALERYATADSMAVYFQRLSLRTLRGLLLLALTAAVCFQVYAFLASKPWLLAFLYLAALAVGYGWFLLARWGCWHNKYLDYRALAEGMRTHLFWRLAGLGDAVADHYLRRQRGELDWIRQALRVWSIPDVSENAASVTPAAQPLRMELVLEHWVRDQLKFYSKASKEAGRRLWLIGCLGYVFFLVGMGMAVIKLLSVFHVLPQSNNPALLTMSLTMIVAGFLHVYVQVLGLNEHAKQYGRMSLLFGNAAERIQECLNAGHYDDARVLIKELGLESLAENGDWVLLHRQRPPEGVRGKI